MRDSYFRDLLKFINMVSVKLKFRSSSIDGNLGSLYYQVVYQRVVRQISTPYKIMKKEWDANSCTLVIKINDKDRYNYLQVLQKRIQWDKKKLMRIIDLYINSGIVFSVDSIVEAYKNEINDMTLFKYTDKLVLKLKNNGQIEKELHNYNKAIVYYNEAITLSKEINASEMLVSALNDLALGYMYSKDFQNALHYIKESIKIAEKDSLEINESRYTTIGQIYLKLNQLDSAEFYIKKALTSSNVYRLENAYITLHNIYNKKNLYKEASSSLAKAWIYNDSITKLDKSRTLIEMQEKYDQQKVKDEAETELRLQKQRTQMYIGGIILAVLLIGAYARHRYRQRIARLAEAEERIDTLNRMLEEAQQATNEDDAFVKRMLLQQLGVIRLVAGTPTVQNQALLRRLSELGNGQVPVEELIVWEDLYPIIDRLYNRFHTRLKERYGSLLTDKEMQTCCLLCAGFSTKEIGVITHQSASSIYVRKTSIRKKIGAEEGADIVGFVNETEGA